MKFLISTIQVSDRVDPDVMVISPDRAFEMLPIEFRDHLILLASEDPEKTPSETWEDIRKVALQGEVRRPKIDIIDLAFTIKKMGETHDYVERDRIPVPKSYKRNRFHRWKSHNYRQDFGSWRN